MTANGLLNMSVQLNLEPTDKLNFFHFSSGNPFSRHFINLQNLKLNTKVTCTVLNMSADKAHSR